MEMNFWGKALKDGEKLVLGEEVSDLMTNVALANPSKGKALVKVNGKMVVALSPAYPHAMFRGKSLIDSATTVSIEGSEVHVTGYSASFSIITDSDDEECKTGCCPSSKSATCGSKKSPALSKAKSPSLKAEASKPLKKTSSKKSNLNGPDFPIHKVVNAENRVLPDLDLGAADASPVEQEVEAGILEMKVNGKMQQLFINWRDFSVYSGDPEDAVFEGWFHPDKKIIHKTEQPKHKVPELTQRIKQATAFAKRSAEQVRKEWDDENDGAASDVTIASYVLLNF